MLPDRDGRLGADCLTDPVGQYGSARYSVKSVRPVPEIQVVPRKNVIFRPEQNCSGRFYFGRKK